MKNQLTVDEWVYFWTLNSVTLIYMCILMPLAHSFENFDCFNYFWLLCSKFWNWDVLVLQLSFLFSRLLWIFWDPWISTWFIGSVSSFLQHCLIFAQLFTVYQGNPHSFFLSTNIDWAPTMCQTQCQVLWTISHGPCLQGAKHLVGEADISQIITKINLKWMIKMIDLVMGDQENPSWRNQ